MPELPEVEIIKLTLQKRIVGLKVKKVQINSAKSFLGNPNKAEGKKVKGIWRRAKILGVDLGTSLRDHEVAKPAPPAERGEQSNSKIATSPTAPRDVPFWYIPRNDDSVTLLFHLKMSGQLIYEDGRRFIGGHPTPDMVGKMPNSHTRVVFSFSDGSHLYFNDQRKFGWVTVSEKGKLNWEKSLINLGPEPLDKKFTWQILKTNLLRHKSMPIKVAIMDQSIVSGVGNIYSNEACFAAKLDPRTKVGDLGDRGFKAIHKGVIKVIKEGIKYGGSTRVHFVDAEGRKGYFLDYAYCYGRDKHPCKICGTEIKKIQLGGRGTYFCPKCQK